MNSSPGLEGVGETAGARGWVAGLKISELTEAKKRKKGCYVIYFKHVALVMKQIFTIPPGG